MKRILVWLVGVAIVTVGIAYLRPARGLGGTPQTHQGPGTSSGGVEHLRVKVISSHPHDRSSFTQGLLFHEGSLFESTGQYGSSTLQEVDPESGQVLRQRNLDPHLFGEGLTSIGDQLIQLTWREGTALVWNREALEVVQRHHYVGEGWGLCWDGRQLYMSDGSDRLTLRDAETFAELGVVRVTLEGQPVRGLNELECAEGWVYANVWGEESILRIEPFSGRVAAVIDAAGLLLPGERDNADVFNGIAFDASTKTFFVTGKLWPRLFRVRFEPLLRR